MRRSASSPLFVIFVIFFLLAGPALAQFRCPELAQERVCAVAESGFEYDDGCNVVTCTGNGMATSTLMLCQDPVSSEDLRECDRLSRAVWSRLGPFECPNVDADAVCRSRSGDGEAATFAFSDGCNRVRCLRGGGHAKTRMSCPAADPAGPYCRFVAFALTESQAKPRTDVAVEPEFECLALNPGSVCAENLPGFVYHDGCREVTCLSHGLARVPSGRDCPAPPYGNAAAAAYCEAAERRMLDKKGRSSFQTVCLNAESVCRASRTAELAFFDGCNHCVCLQDREAACTGAACNRAACTRAACHAVFLTPEEFARHCKKVGAGVLSKK